VGQTSGLAARGAIASDASGVETAPGRWHVDAAGSCTTSGHGQTALTPLNLGLLFWLVPMRQKPSVLLARR
jgi:hypothetical protein